MGKLLGGITMSLDGFVAGPNHAMDWMSGISFRPGLVAEYAETTGAVLARIVEARAIENVAPDGSIDVNARNTARSICSRFASPTPSTWRPDVRLVPP